MLAITTLAATTEIASAQTEAPSTYNVSWKKDSPTQADNWSYTDTQWIFGPTANMTVAYLDGTLLINTTGGTPTNYLQIGRQFYVNISIPKNLLQLGRSLNTTMFTFYKDQYSTNGTELWLAEVSMQYNSGSPGSWETESDIYNYTVGGSSNQFSQTEYFILNQTACKYDETSDHYSVRFQGEMNKSATAIASTYTCYCDVFDNEGSDISGGVFGQMVLIKPDPTTFGYGGEYLDFSCYFSDMTSAQTEIVSIGKPFQVVAQLFSGDITKVKNISIYMDPPVGESWWSSSNNSLKLTEWKTITSNGYYYNYANDTFLQGSHTINGTREVRLTWNNTGAMSIDDGFVYENYTGPSFDNLTYLFQTDHIGGSYFYLLDKQASNKDLLSSGEIAFAVTISPSANASAGTYGATFDGYSVSNEEMSGFFTGSFSIQGSNVVMMELLKENSDSVALRITPGKYLRAAMNITGTPTFRTAVAAHITNITFTFSSPSQGNDWTVGNIEYWNYSYLDFYLTLNSLKNNKTYVDVFNCTYGGWYNTVTDESNETSSQVLLPNWSDYVEIPATNNFTMSYNDTDHTLLVALNFTFNPGVPEGDYDWSGYLGNKTYYSASNYSYPDLNDLGNDALKYLTITVPETATVPVGNVASYGYWSDTPQTWNTNNKLSALDLDGNNKTTSDQFFVLAVYNSTSYWTQSENRMTVNLDWGNYSMWSYFALVNYTWSYEWNETYIWFYANNMTHVPQSRFASLINNTVWDTTDDVVQPNYSQIGQYCINMTWDQIKSEYAAYGWWQPEYSWNWLEIGFDQNFWTPTKSGGSSNNLSLQYAGLLLFNDTNNDGVLNVGCTSGTLQSQELTHYFVLEDAKGISFTPPFPGDSGNRTLSVNDGVAWGLSLDKVNGTTYPTVVAGQDLAGLSWWWHDCYGVYQTAGNFSTVPSEVGISNLNFTAHFSIPNANLTAGAVNQVRVKIDEAVGPWTLYDQPQNAIRNYSLAIAYLASSSMSQYSFQTKSGATVLSDNSSVASDYYNVSSGTTKLADIQMGGTNYTWGKDGKNYTMHSSTTPMSAFQQMYSSYSMTGNGNATISSFSVVGTNYFMTSSFKRWGGYSVNSDPYFAVYSGYNAPPGSKNSSFTIVLVTAVASVVALVAAVVVVKRRRPPKLQTPPPSQTGESPKLSISLFLF
jgi:hypothetical protein